MFERPWDLHSSALSYSKPRPTAAIPALVVGCSGHARVVIDAIEEEGLYHVIGLLDSFKSPGSSSFDYHVIGTEEELPPLWKSRACETVVVAVGDNWTRAQLVARIRAMIPEVRLGTVVHPSAKIARDVSLGAGTVVMAGAVVNTGTRVGECCILNTRCSLDHDCTMDDFSSLAPGTTTGGGVHIGAYAAIAIGATISHGRRIGEHAVVGANATVLRDVPPNVIAYGTPARIVRQRRPEDPYL
jgi:sugar O-acyltransferase (sialic acid O-acetyltransferase NeuD family)